MPSGDKAAKRRGPRGLGSVYKETLPPRKDGSQPVRWVGAVSLPGGTRKRVTAATEKEALAKLKKLLSDQVRGIPISTDRQTVEQFLNSWLTNTLRVRPTTLVTYEVCVRVHIIPAVGRYQLAALRPEHVEQMMRAMEAKGYAAHTVNMSRAVLRQALGVAVKRQMIASNAAALTDTVREVRAEPEPLSAEECQAWLAKLRGASLGALYVTAMTTGLRIGELLGLRWQDVDLDHARLMVRQQVQLVKDKDGKKHPTFTPPKTRTSTRAVNMPSLLVDELRAHRAGQDAKRAELGEYWRDLDLVFPNPVGEPRSGQAVWMTFQRALTRAGLERHPFHYLRHVYQSMLVSLGVHPFVSMELMGHSEIRTSRIYSHVHEASKIAAVDQLDALLRA